MVYLFGDELICIRRTDMHHAKRRNVVGGLSPQT